MMNYLIVEDEPALGETLRAYLAKDGQAVLATSLAQANERVAADFARCHHFRSEHARW